ncbi:MAG TPA: cohesin domain-containing protein [Candidatus Cryosericum sp.]|nr:cohesin domain-containing protein [Candidatus Cryosericum sp.]
MIVVTVHVSDADSMSSLPFHLRFDPQILEYVGSEAGPELAASHEAVLLASVNPNRPGDLAVGLSLVESSGLFTGSGALVLLQFRAVAEGESDLEFDRATLRGATSQPLDARFEKTRITVR